MKNLINISNKQFYPQDLHEANLYITEDRLISTNVYFLKNKKYILTYSPLATARADPVLYFGSIMNQRKRWQNGNFFGMIDVLLDSFAKIKDTKHSLW